jgi:1H-pyrrole-2-carbonyl-[peptidyl-carrier protein] chlorinase
MTPDREYDADVIVVGGGPAGSTLAGLLARDGVHTLLIEKDIHPREHQGEPLSPSTTSVLEGFGVLEKLDDAGFVHKTGTAWNTPSSQPSRFAEMRLTDDPDGTERSFTYNLERDELDAILLRHAHELGAKVLQGVEAQHVIFEEGRAVGIRARVSDGWERDLFARIVVDGSGRGCLLVDQLGLKRNDPSTDRLCISAWFDGVNEPPPPYAGFTLAYLLGPSHGLAWQTPLRKGRTSMGFVVGEEDLLRAGEDPEGFFSSLVRRNATFTDALKDATRVRPFRVGEGSSYVIDRYAGPGWMLVGDTLRFDDPIFSSGVDLALFSALSAQGAITDALRTGEGDESFERYHTQLTAGIDVRRDLISTLYERQMVLIKEVTSPHGRGWLVRALQADPYQAETWALSQAVVERMKDDPSAKVEASFGSVP